MTADLLDALDGLLGRFVAFPSDGARHAVAAWTLHCWVVDAFDSTPRLALLSPEKGSGKTRTLEVIEQVVPQAKHTVNMSAAVLFRLVGDEQIGTVTLLMDEADTYLGWKAAAQHEDLRGLVNAGHRKGARAYRMQMEGGARVQEFPAFAPVALAGIGDLPDTILDRSIVVSMKRRAPDEHVDPFRCRLVEPQVAHLVDALTAWADTAEEPLRDLVDDLTMPDGIADRAADVWEPLVAIGDLAGEPWTSRLRTAAVTLNSQRAERDPSLGVQLLRDVREVFTRLDVDRLPSADLARHLVDIEGAPWADLRGSPIDAQGIAKRLKPYGIRPGSHWFGDASGRGYLREDLHDAWTRYLPPAGSRDARDARDDTAPSITPITPITGHRGEDPTCQTCGQPATAVDRDGTNRCRDHTSWADACASCGQPSLFPSGDPLCPTCRKATA